MKKHLTRRDIFIYITGSMILLLLLPTIINALLPQASLFIFSRQIIPYGQVKLILLPILLISLFFGKSKIRFNYTPSLSILVFSAYIFLTLLLHMGRSDFDYIFYGIINNYYIYLILAISLFLDHFIPYKIMKRTILWAAIFCSILGICQYFFNTPVVAVKDVESGFEVLSWVFYAATIPHVRAFSFFSSPLDFGLFLIFSLGITLYNVFEKKKIYFIVLVLILLAAASTLTRNVFLGIGFSMIAVILYKYAKNRKILVILPFISMFFGILIASGVNSDNKGLTSGETLNIRNYYWSREIERQKNNNLGELLFGSGLYQTGGENSETRIFVDNSFLLLLAQIGILGLFLFIWMYYCILQYISKRYKNDINAGMYGFIVAWPIMAIFNIVITELSVFVLIVMATAIKYELSSVSQHKNSNMGALFTSKENINVR